ncbi:sensor domain-containing diguanylate cyclase [Photobacterium leiognathi]|uniref:sensor domain-containing diguanylate cyclase n=1 Tax=Photobacterium leiognathi TaxID=553611 RepID=UPI0002087F6D|nr:diguanylate cyclase [Photobacterium leiognathi]PSW53224.1 GGDEF domain-containing protein [Photobacterium leiognathi subsp. mandapamensis]GAA04215.1 diguanylate cyclase [Photobacterium leiognathi subsp. mandapamensis svers.1.1.]
MSDISLADFHLTMQVLDHLDAGIVILDKNYNVYAWNTFMQSYSGISTEQIMGKSLFDVVPHLPEKWLKNKIASTFKLRMRSFSAWEDRPWVFKFTNFSPISGSSDYMFQNMTLTPLKSLTGEYTHICLTVTDVTDIAKSKNHLRESNAQLTHLSITDRLTQLYNRGHWENCLSDEFDRYQQLHQPMTLVMFDIDHFKKVNDTYGHVAGDAVIKNIASIVRSAKRQSDIAGRYGGEEFGVILPGTTADMTSYFTERLRKKVEKSSIEVDGTAINVTISLGICELHSGITNYESWLEQTDSALYESKKNGRNQTTVITEEGNFSPSVSIRSNVKQLVRNIC